MEDLASSQETTSTETESTVQDSAPQETQAAVETPSQDAAPVVTEPVAPVAPEFTPNWKVKVLDKEHEIPEWARAGVKNAELEKQAREIFEKAYGLDVVKPKYQEIRQKYQEVNQKHTGIMAELDMARQYVEKGDFESFFKHLALPEEQVLKYFLEKAKMMEAPPEQRQAYQMKLDAERRAQAAEQRATQVEEEYQGRLKNDTLDGLRSEFSKPEVTDFAKQFDTRLGKEGAFMEEVVRRGDFYWKSGSYVPPNQVVAEVMKLGGYSPAPATMGAQVQPSQQKADNNQVVKPAASIPAVSGRSAAPMSQQIGSVEELIELRKKKFGS